MRRIFITGASTGIGAALARYYAGPQTEIGLFARRRDLLEQLAASLPGKTAVYAADITDVEAIAGAAQDFLRRFGAPDLVIANAGISVGTRGEELGDVAKLRRVLDVNVAGLAATPEMSSGLMLPE